MARIKEQSTIQENKRSAFEECPVTYVMEKIGGYWKPIILFQLLSGSKRYSDVRRAIPAITEKVLIQQLKQLEADGLVQRKAMPVVPPHVTYSLTKTGMRLKPVLYAMAVWAVDDSKEHGAVFRRNLKNFPGANDNA
ncbi:HxlR family transcriptional regulator [Chitinophaga polysaccharea]|uniref:Helix-turn-helix transcriptional regulator n=2 Tax=Chitinophaga TaxID=79328 RepID=A0A847SKQ6_9BACT|nr:MULTISPECIES: helix-turn-helix domain-containing protein [Chitinophaga]NLR57573.1 helix-turn-helix transcriptional regulator [Chitinophaga polysaccharea]NLR78138.1 helix-turn-helix transcriptional regulator [Chitinophaga eiseniae]NLU95487.1 helix-turn-helix transcriptional regulator [Chitinophaga sp. Ak27]TWF40722.1 HxlR family transcriptional regulator [Chitinophaga polysaccharea]